MNPAIAMRQYLGERILSLMACSGNFLLSKYGRSLFGVLRWRLIHVDKIFRTFSDCAVYLSLVTRCSEGALCRNILQGRDFGSVSRLSFAETAADFNMHGLPSCAADFPSLRKDAAVSTYLADKALCASVMQDNLPAGLCRWMCVSASKAVDEERPRSSECWRL